MFIFWQIPVITKQCFQNIWKTFHEFLFSKIFQGYPRNIVKLWKCFYEVKKFGELSCEFFVLAVSFIETFSHWEQGAYSNVLKMFMCMLGSWKMFKIRITLLSIHNIIIFYFINIFRQVFNASVCSTQAKIFVIAYVFDIIWLGNMLQIFFNCSNHGSTSLQTRIVKPSNHCVFTCFKSPIKTLEEDVKYFQS